MASTADSCLIGSSSEVGCSVTKWDAPHCREWYTDCSSAVTRARQAKTEAGICAGAVGQLAVLPRWRRKP